MLVIYKLQMKFLHLENLGVLFQLFKSEICVFYNWIHSLNNYRLNVVNIFYIYFEMSFIWSIWLKTM